MHALKRRDRAMPGKAGNYRRRLTGGDLGERAMMPYILLAPPNPALSLMAGVPDAGKPAGDRPRRTASGRDHSGIWLRNAAAGLCLLAAAAAVVSFTAQYRLIYATRRLAMVAGLEAAIPDAAALVFACLGIALALPGRRPRRAVAGGLVWWRLRRALAPVSTVAGFRAWVVGECPVAPRRRQAPAPGPASSPHPAGVPRKATKTARFLDLAAERAGSLASIPLDRVAGIAADLAPLADLNTGSARAALRKAVLAARNGDPRR